MGQFHLKAEMLKFSGLTDQGRDEKPFRPFLFW
jgi:hypothetical protein